mmetsp:Transcript_23165/g.57405  ORF Transcript_23165/g.57405 Transcript_23165/m.57405 type:complete len:243 (-) Transcript_23165:362-1090(-)
MYRAKASEGASAAYVMVISSPAAMSRSAVSSTHPPPLLIECEAPGWHPVSSNDGQPLSPPSPPWSISHVTTPPPSAEAWDDHATCGSSCTWLIMSTNGTRRLWRAADPSRPSSSMARLRTHDNAHAQSFAMASRASLSDSVVLATCASTASASPALVLPASVPAATPRTSPPLPPPPAPVLGGAPAPFSASNAAAIVRAILASLAREMAAAATASPTCSSAISPWSHAPAIGESTTWGSAAR